MRSLLARVALMTLGWSLFVTTTPALAQLTGETIGGPPGITVNPTSGLTTTEAGGTATFSIVLTTLPSADVTIGLSSSAPAEGTVIAGVTFTPANWDTPQVVVITGQDDIGPDGDQAYTIITNPATSSDPGYNGINPPDVSVTNQDNDGLPSPGFTVTPTGGLTVDENGGTADFTVALNTQPAAVVTLPLSVSDPGEASLSTTSLTFTGFNGTTPQTVTVTGLDDAIMDGDVAFTIITGDPSSQDTTYDAFTANDIPDVSATNQDNEGTGPGAGFTVNPLNLTVDESGATANFTVALNTIPTSDVSLPIVSSDLTEVTVSTSSLTFTTANGTNPLTVTVTGVDDAAMDGNVNVTVVLGDPSSQDPNYDVLGDAQTPDVMVLNQDDDTVMPGFNVAPLALTTNESGMSATFTVTLTTMPTSDVSFPLTVDDPSEGSVMPVSLTFTAANWNVPQTVTVTGQDDGLVDGDQVYNVLTGTTASADPNYTALNPPDVSCTNQDNDTVGINIVPSSVPLVTNEAGATATFDVVLQSEPSADVSIGFTVSDATEGSVSPSGVLFSSASWNIPQTVTVTGLDDNDPDGNINYQIATAPASSADPNYNGIDPPDVECRNDDDGDGTGVTVTPSGFPVITSEDGVSSGSFSVVLNTTPTDDVIISFGSDDTGEGTVSPAVLTFTPTNWDTPQSATITGVDDALADGDVDYSILFNPITSNDTFYNGVLLSPVSCRNLNDDSAGVSISGNNPLQTSEGGQTDTLTIALSTEPLADVTFDLMSNDPGEGVVMGPSSLVSVTFTPLNWNVPQTFTVQGVDDMISDGDVAYGLAFSAFVSSDPAYNGIRLAPVPAVNMDDDQADIIINALNDPLTTDEGGLVDSFSVVLSAEPSSDVTLTISSSDETEGQLTLVPKTPPVRGQTKRIRSSRTRFAPVQLVFNTGNWSVPQVIEVVGQDDADQDGDQNYTIITAPAVSSDPAYSGFDPIDLNAVNLDNDNVGVAVLPARTPLITDENGGQDFIDVLLTSPPSADVTFQVTTDNPAEGDVPAKVRDLTFTPTNWNQPQSISVVGVDDGLADGTVSYHVVLGPVTSADPNYNGLTIPPVDAINLDNDTAAINVITSTLPLTTSEDAATDSFDVVLSSEPAAPVTLTIDTNNAGEGAIAPSVRSLVFDNTNWDQPRNVTVVGVDDALTDGPVNYLVTFAPAVSKDPAYSGQDPDDLPAVNLDNDLAQILVMPNRNPLRTSEDGDSDFLDLVLSSQPTADVSIDVDTSDPGEGVVASRMRQIVFTSANWNTPQRVVINGVDDPNPDGLQTYQVTIAPAMSNDPNYSGLDAPDLPAVNQDNDAAEIIVEFKTTPPLMTDENGLDDGFVVRLSTQPSADVVLPVVSNDGTEGAASPSVLTFTPANWDTPQGVNVVGLDDIEQDGDISYDVAVGPAVSNDPAYDGLSAAPVPFLNKDNDLVEIVVDPSHSPLLTDENGLSDTISVVLTSAPSADVTLNVASSNTAEGVVSASVANLTFTPANWAVPQVVTVTGVDDGQADGDTLYTIVFAPAVSADPNYNGFDPDDVSARNVDNDSAGVLVAPAHTPMETDEDGGFDSFAVNLTTEPGADVTIALASSNPGEGMLSATSLVFTPSNWNVPQTVSVIGVDDQVGDGDVPYTILVGPVVSNDPSYNGLDPGDPTVINHDNDLSGIMVHPFNLPLTTTESGGQDIIELVLASQPLDDVFINVDSDNTAEGVVSQALIQVVFTPVNWDTPQQLVVTGVDDGLSDGHQNYNIVLGPVTSNDPAYNGADLPLVPAVNLDDDSATLIIQPSGLPLTTNENGISAFVDLVLTSEPNAPVAVPVGSTDTGEGVILPQDVFIFTAATWNQPQRVELAGVDDPVQDGDIQYAVTIGPLSSSDPAYDGQTFNNLPAVNLDNDTAAILVFSGPQPLITHENGASAVFEVALSNQPTADVNVPLTSGDPSEGLLTIPGNTPGSVLNLVFTPMDWDQSRMVEIVPVDDGIIDGPAGYTIAVGPATSSDPSYNGLTAAAIGVLNVDTTVADLVINQVHHPLITSESGLSDNFTVALSAEPTDTVVLDLISSDTNEAVVAASFRQITFSPSDWNQPRTVTVNPVDDANQDGPVTYQILTSTLVSNDANYNGVDPADLEAINYDDDTAGIAVITQNNPLITSEDGVSDQFAVVLTTAPTADVTIGLSSLDPSEASVSPGSLTFTTANWNTPQSVTVTGVDDAIADGEVFYLIDLAAAVSTDPEYNGKDGGDVGGLNGDNDLSNILVMAPQIPLQTSEDGTIAQFSVVLGAEPTDDVTIPVASDNPGEATVDLSTLVFTPSTWDQPKTVMVTGVDDAVPDGDAFYLIELGPVSSNDPAYSGFPVDGVPGINQDNDSGAVLILLDNDPLMVSEDGGTDGFAVVLGAEPSADVSLTLRASDPTEVSVQLGLPTLPVRRGGGPGTVTMIFTPQNWSEPQIVTVMGLDDQEADGDILSQIITDPAVSNDPIYSGFDPIDPGVVNQDNDEGAVSVTPSQVPMITNEDGLQDSFTIVLTAQPNADVVVDMTSSDPTEGLVSLSMTQIVFTAADWNMPRTVNVIGQDDAVVDGPVPYQIIIPPVSSNDPAFNGINPPDLDVVNNDNDGGAGGVIVMSKGPLVTSEAGQIDGFGVVLGSQPTANVTVPIQVSDATEAEIFGGLVELVFTPANWDQVRDVEVVGLDDTEQDGDVAYQIKIGPTASSDPNYDGQDPPDLDAVNLDDDSAQILVFVDHPLPLETNESGGSDFFNIALGTQPKADVSIEVQSSDVTEGTIVEQLTLLFTPANWNQPQTVGVMGVDDVADDGPVSYQVLILPAVSTDTAYNGLDANDLPAVNGDDDGAEIIVQVDHPLPLVTDESGGADSFRVRLGSQPTADVSLAINSSDPGEGVVSQPLTLVFTPADWDQPKTVDVVGVDDMDEDGPVNYRVILSPAVSADPNYNGVDPPDLDAVNNDNDGAQIIVTLDHAPPLRTTEDGGNDFLEIVLSAEPTADVSLEVLSSDITEGALSQNLNLVFTPADWDQPKTIEVFGVDDAEPDGAVNYRIQILAAVSDDPRYDGSDPADIDAVNEDNDQPGISVNPANIPLITSENGDSDFIEMFLTVQPTANVLVHVVSSNPNEGTVVPNAVDLIFTTDNWNQPQTIAVAGVDDGVIDGPVQYQIQLGPLSSDDPNYNGLTVPPIPAVNNDNDAAGFVVIPDTAPILVTDESGFKESGFTVALATQPTDNVTLQISSSDPSEGSVARPPLAFGTTGPVTVTFSTTDWDLPRRVDLLGKDDDELDGDIIYQVVFGAAVSNDPAYNGLTAPPLDAVNRDNDSAGLVLQLSEEPMITDESGDTASFTLALSSPPTADVTVRLESSDLSEITVAQGLVELVFTPLNWDTPRAVTVTGVDDPIADGPAEVAVVFEPLQSADPDYSGVQPPPIPILNLDNEVAGILVNTDGPLTTTESGGADTLTVVLSLEPTANVVIPFASSDLTEGTVSPASLTFTPANWDTPQTVTVTGVDDAVFDGDVGYNVLIGPAQSNDPEYQGQDPIDPPVLNLEDEGQPAFLVEAPQVLTTHEGGGVSAFFISLSSEPLADVNLRIESSDTTEGVVAQGVADLVFTPQNWDQPVRVVVTGVDDALEDGAVNYTVILNPAVSSDPAYNQVDPPDLPAVNLDNEGAGLVIQPGALETFESDTSGVPLAIRLSSPPSANVVIPIAISDPSQATLADDAPLVFTPDNWNEDQVVMLTSVDDLIDEGDDNVGTPYQILLGPITSDDPGYGILEPAPVPARDFDNDTAQLLTNNPGPLVTSESGTNDDFSLTLNSQPTADVMVQVESDDTTEAVVSAGVAALVFTPDNWDLPKRMIVNGVDDVLDDDNGGGFTINVVATSDDPFYDGQILGIEGFNTDNDDPVSFVSLTGPSTINEGGGATYTVRRTNTTGSASVIVSSLAGTATRNVDYTSVQQTINFSPGQASAGVTLTTIQDTLPEDDETLTLRLSSASGVVISGGSVSITIIDNDEGLPGTFRLSAPPNVTEGGTATVQINRSGGSTGSVGVTVATGGGTATAGQDYQSVNQTLTFANGQLSAQFNITILQDTLVEEPESFNINLTTANGGSDQATIIINDDDVAQPGVLNLSGPGQINEGQSGVFTVSRSGGTDGPASVNVVFGGPDDTASAGDVSPGSATLSFANGEASKTFSVQAVQDEEPEVLETFTLALAGATGAAIGENGVVTFSIIDDDEVAPATVAWETASQSVLEDDTAKRSFEVNVTAVLNAPPLEAVSFPFTVGGTAVFGQDHDLSPGTVTFAPGQVRSRVSFLVLGDTEVEENETITLTLPGGGERSVHTVTILDNDEGGVQTVRWATEVQRAVEGQSVSVSALLSVAPTEAVTVGFNVGGNATSADHTLSQNSLTFAPGETQAVLTFDIIDDDQVEVEEVLALTLVSDTVTVVSPNQLNVLIEDNDQLSVRFASPGQSVTEGTGVVTDVNVGLVLSAPAPAPLSVPFNVGGSADGEDHNLGAGSVTFEVGQTTATLSFTVFGDELQEPDETIILNLRPGGPILGEPSSHVVNVVNDDQVSVSWALAQQSVTELGDGQDISAGALLNLSGPSAQPVSVAFVVGGDATLGEDHNLVGRTVTFDPGETQLELFFDVLGDDVQESDETITLTLQPGGTPLGEITTHTLTIVDDDLLLAEWTTNIQFVTEGNSAKRAEVTVSAVLNGPVAETLSVPFSVGGTAEPGVDHDLGSTGTLTFEPGSQSASLSFNVLGDAVQELEETIVLTLQADVVGVGAVAVQTIVIEDDDQMLAAWSGGAQIVNEGDAKRRAAVTVTAVLSQPAPSALSVAYVVAGTATVGLDHNLTAGSLNFAEGSQTADLVFEVLDDSLQEAREVVVITLVEGDVAVGAAAVQRVTIEDNDLNQAPETTITSPAPGTRVQVGREVTFAGIGVDPQGDPTTLSWEICATTGGCFTRTDDSFTLAIDEAGVYSITCVATDEEGNQDQTPATRTLTVEERLGPEVAMTSPTGDVSVTVGDTVSFSAEASGDDVSLAWFLISNPAVTLGTGATFTRTFDSEGFFTVAVRATDAFGDTATDSRTVEVSPPAGRDPVLTITAPTAGATFAVGEEIQFSGTVTDPDSKRKAFSFFWETGDGRRLDGENPVATYDNAGNVQVRFAGVDGDILIEDTVNIFIVANEPPVVDFNFPTDKEIQPAETAKEGRNSEIFFSAVVVDSQGYQDLSFFWDFGDGATSRQETPGSKSYQNEGLYTVSLYAVSPNGVQSDTVTRRVRVRRSTDERFEPNEDFQQAPVLTPGNYENLLLDENSLDDFYRVQIVRDGQALTLRLNVVGNGLVEIFDVSRRLIRSRAISGDGSLQVRGLKKGTYFVRVGPAPGAKMGLTYSFGVSVLNPALYFPEIQVSETFTTQLGIVNTTGSEVSMEATGYDARGNILGTVQLDLPAQGRTHRSVTDLFPDNAENLAWVQVDSTAELIGYSRTASRDRQELFSMNANKRLSAELYVPHIAENTQQWFTRAAVVNATNEASVSDIQTGGDNVSALEVDRGFSKDSFDFLDKFGGALPDEERLWARFKEQGDNLFLAGTEVFGTLDGTRIVAGLSLDDIAQDNPNFTFRSKDIYFTHIAADARTFFTGLVLVNVSDSPQTVRVVGYGADGEQRTPKLLELAPREKLVQVAEDFLKGIGTTANVAWVRVESDTEISGFELFGTRDGTRLAGIEAAMALKSRICYPFIDSSGEVDHGITLVNVNQKTNQVTFKLFNDAGVQLREVTQTLNPNQKFVSTLATLFPDLEPDQIPGWLDAVTELPVAGFEIFVDRGGQQMAGINAE